MNSETPRTPREEIEVRLTAHLLGELASDEAAWVEELIAADPELAALHARLRKAIEFLREASAIPEPLEHSSGARLSTERRQKLLEHFKTIPAPPAPPAIHRPRRREWRSLVPLGLAAALIALLGGVVLINGFTARNETRSLAEVDQSVMSRAYLQIKPEREISEFRYGERQVDFDTRTPSQPGSARVVSPTGPPASAPYRLYATVDEAAPAERGRGVGESARRIVLPSSSSKELGDQAVVSGGGGTPRHAGESTTRFNLYSGEESTPANATVPRITAAPSQSTASTTPLGSVPQQPPPAEPATAPDLAAISDGLATAATGKEITAAIVPTRLASDGKSAEAPPVSSLLGEAERFYSTGRYDLATKRYEQALNIDPSNIAARQGQEKMNIAQDDYGLSTNEARARATWKLDNAWSNPVRWFGERKNESAPSSPTILSDPEKGLGATAPSAGRGGSMADGPSAPSEGGQSNVPHYLGFSALAPTASPRDGFDALQDASKGLAVVEDRRLATNGSTSNFGTVAIAGGAIAVDAEPQLQKKLKTIEDLTERSKGKDGGVDWGYIDKDGNMGRLADKREIVAREAFWSDDDALRININTATEVTYWDKPIEEQLLQEREKKTGAAAGRAGERKPASEPVEVAKLEVGKEIEALTKLREEDAPAGKPAAVAPEPQPEMQTRDNPFSTFSLNVSDVAFKLASASLEQGKMPELGTVRSEEFINAFDYRDPEPAPGVRLAFASERAHYPFAQNRDLLRLAVKSAAAGRQPGRALNIVLLLDNSGSMERADRVRIVREALRVLAGQLQATDKLSIVTFARTARLWADGVAGDKAAEVTARAGEIPPQGGTNIAAGLELAYQTAVRHYQIGSINRVVLLTDGAANLGDVNPTALKQKVEAHRRQGIALDCFGVGWEGFNDDLLEALARNGDGRYGFINTPEEAATEFVGQLAGALRVAASDVKVQIEFNPRRVIAYRQIGYAKHQLTKEQFRDNTVDAAEIGAAESGNSLYVIEVNPRGEGDLATVRVRFKIPSTADYREHEWVVPFSGNALPLEQASPGLRLAASAGAFSEWLVSSPYAAEVTPDRLLGYLNGVPEFYGADSRPKKLEWMIRQARSISGR